jgi:methyl coenzyme M reductase alpha subunit
MALHYNYTTKAVELFPQQLKEKLAILEKACCTLFYTVQMFLRQSQRKRTCLSVVKESFQKASVTKYWVLQKVVEVGGTLPQVY